MFHSNVLRFHEPHFYLFLSWSVTMNSEVVSVVKRYLADKFSYEGSFFLATSFVLSTVKNKVFGNWFSTAPRPLKKAFVPFLSDISSIIELKAIPFEYHSSSVELLQIPREWHHFLRIG